MSSILDAHQQKIDVFYYTCTIIRVEERQRERHNALCRSKPIPLRRMRRNHPKERKNNCTTCQRKRFCKQLCNGFTASPLYILYYKMLSKNPKWWTWLGCTLLGYNHGYSGSCIGVSTPPQPVDLQLEKMRVPFFCLKTEFHVL